MDWFRSLALALGVIGAGSQAFAQYNVLPANAYPPVAPQGMPSGGLAPTAYPVVPPASGGLPSYAGFTTQLPASRGVVGPQQGQFQLTGNMQGGMAAPSYGSVAPIPDPQSYGSYVPGPEMQYSGGYAPQMSGAPMISDGGYGSSCTSCGPAQGYPMSTGFMPGPVLTAPRPWFGGASGLIFNRIDDSNLRFTYETGMPNMPMLTSGDAAQKTAGGVEVFAGRYFNCGRNAIVASYWGLFPSEQMALAVNQGPGLTSNMPFTGMMGPNAMPVVNYYNNATSHRLDRSSSYNNVEINILGFGLSGAARAGMGNFGCGGGCGGGNACGSCGPCGNTCAPATSCVGGPCGALIPATCSRLRFTWLGGVRWFQFQDSLTYASSTTDTFYGTTNDDFYYTNNVTNNLVGFQIGGRLNYCLTSCINLYAANKVGIYGNNISYDTRMGTTTMPAFPTAMPSMPYDLHNSQTSVAFLSELEAGVGYRISPCWTLTAGYRAIIASGVATSVGQFPYDFANGAYSYQQQINNDRTLILHGVVVGAQYNF